MEEKKVRIEYKIQRENDELKISLELEEKEALKIFQKLLSTYQKKADNFSLEIKEEKERKVEKQKKEPKQKEKETINQKVMDFIAEHGSVTAKEIANGIGVNRQTVSTYLNRMKLSGKIINPDGIVTQYCINNGLNQLPVKDKQKQKQQELGRFDKLISNEKCLEIMEYIMQRDSFKMNSVRKKFQQYEELIPDVIKALTSEEQLIDYDEGKEEYSTPNTTKIWYFLLKEGEAVQDAYISFKLGIKFDKEFIEILQMAKKQRLIEEITRNGRISYKVKLR